MNKIRIALAGALLAAGVGLAGCATDGYYGGGYGGYYGYNGGYYDGYYDGGYYGPSYYGWYDNFYYPGTGIYVYDRNHHRHRWNDRQRDYWRHRGSQYRGSRPHDGNWDRFHHWSGRNPGNNGGGHHWQGSHRGNGGHHRGGQSAGSSPRWSGGNQHAIGRENRGGGRNDGGHGHRQRR